MDQPERSRVPLPGAESNSVVTSAATFADKVHDNVREQADVACFVASGPRRSGGRTEPRPLNPAPPCSSGFTLIELLVTLVILSTGIVLVLEAFETALTALRESRSALLADSVVAESLSAAELRIRAREAPSAMSSRPEGAFADFRGDVAARDVTAEQVSDARSNTLYEVRVTVRQAGSGRDYSAATYVLARTPEGRDGVR